MFAPVNSRHLPPDRLAALGFPVVEVYESNGRGGIGAAGWHAPVAIAVRDATAAQELLRMLSLTLLAGGYARARIHASATDVTEWLVSEEHVAARVEAPR